MPNKMMGDESYKNCAIERFTTLRSRLLAYWSLVLDRETAKEQVKFEIGGMIYRAREQGMTAAKVIEWLGINKASYYDILSSYMVTRHSPIDADLSLIRSDLFRLTGTQPTSIYRLEQRVKWYEKKMQELTAKLTSFETNFTTLTSLREALARLEIDTPALKNGLPRSPKPLPARKVVKTRASQSSESVDFPSKVKEKNTKLPRWLRPIFPGSGRRA